MWDWALSPIGQMDTERLRGPGTCPRAHRVLCDAGASLILLEASVFMSVKCQAPRAPQQALSPFSTRMVLPLSEARDFPVPFAFAATSLGPAPRDRPASACCSE